MATLSRSFSLSVPLSTTLPIQYPETYDFLRRLCLAELIYIRRTESPCFVLVRIICGNALKQIQGFFPKLQPYWYNLIHTVTKMLTNKASSKYLESVSLKSFPETKLYCYSFVSEQNLFNYTKSAALLATVQENTSRSCIVIVTTTSNSKRRIEEEEEWDEEQ